MRRLVALVACLGVLAALGAHKDRVWTRAEIEAIAAAVAPSGSGGEADTADVRTLNGHDGAVSLVAGAGVAIDSTDASIEIASTLGTSVSWAELDAAAREHADTDTLSTLAGTALLADSMPFMPWIFYGLVPNGFLAATSWTIDALRADFYIRGNNAAARTITLGQQMTFDDVVNLDVPAANARVGTVPILTTTGNRPAYYFADLLGWSGAVGTGASFAGASSGNIKMADIGTAAGNQLTGTLTLPPWIDPTALTSLQVGVRISGLNSGDTQVIPMRAGVEYLADDESGDSSIETFDAVSDTAWVVPGQGGGSAGAREPGPRTTWTLPISLAADEVTMWVAVSKDTTTTNDTRVLEFWGYVW